MAALAAVILLISSGCASSQTATGKKHSIALVTKSTTSAFWHSVKAGAGAAAAEYNLDFTFEGPEKEEDYETQNRMIREAVERGAEALVISAVDYNANAEAVDQAADAAQHALEESARRDHSGIMSHLLQNHRINDLQEAK